MAKPTLTDKKLSDKRFKRTEKAILGAFFDSDSLNVKTIAKNAGVARSTMYFHHKTVRDIVSDYEKYLLKKYVRKIHKTLMQKNIKIETILMQTMIFMMMNRYYFGIVLRGNSRTLLEKMIDVIDLRIMHEMGISKRKRRIFTIYKSEVVVILEEWGRRGFRHDEVTRVVNDMIYLLRTARIRLGIVE